MPTPSRKEPGLSSPESRSTDGVCRQYSFGDFTLDLERGVLLRGTDEVRLRPKPFQTLRYLVEHHGRLVTKTALIEAVWPDTAVMDNSLAQCLVEIRRAIGDDSQELIRTIPRRGYLFTAPVSAPVLEFPHQPSGVSGRSDPFTVELKPAPRKSRNRNIILVALVLLTVAVSVPLLVWLGRPPRHELSYTQITDFTDSAVAPALSPDGRMVAFIRSDYWFLTPDQIYVKLLPTGEPIQITHDPRPKCCLAFSPDGSELSYTVGPPGWRTFRVSPLGGESKLFLANAAGLTWLDQRRLLFSEIRTGTHMGVVTAAEDRSDHHRVYFPRNERAMAHFSYASPDRKWALVVEMDPGWQPCRLVPLDGSSDGRQVGPEGKCTAAAWSPDGEWMYFSAEVGGNRHLWRQRFPNGKLDQITSGPTEEEGLAVAPDGRSLITSIGSQTSAVFIHDAGGEHPISSEGYVAPMRVFPYSSARFSPDGKLLYYLMRRDSPGSMSELWRTDLVSRRSEPVLRGRSMLEYDLSSDGKEVLFTTKPSGVASQLWLTALNRNLPPKLIASGGEGWPRFGPDGEVLFQGTEGKVNYLFRMKKDGSSRSRVVPFPVGNIFSTSPDRRWIVVGMSGAVVAVAVDEGAVQRICQFPCSVAWAPDGRFLYVGVEAKSRTGPGKTLAIPLAQGETFPNLPNAGIRSVEDEALLPGSRVIDGWGVSPGPDPSTFAYVKTTVHCNLFRITLNND
jgi:DNA-binding winged helix-turn-helix (wHTH) protein/Tol biopolymer transport system component